MQMSTVDLQSEVSQIIFGADLIAEATEALNLPVDVMIAASIFYHRYISVRGWKTEGVILIAMTAVFLAAKVQECQKKEREILMCFYNISRNRKELPIKQMDVSCSAYREWKGVLIFMEALMLREIGFDLYTLIDENNPHKSILFILKVLNIENDNSDSKTLSFAQAAWNYLNDSLRMGLTLTHSPKAMCAGAIYLAARRLEIPLNIYIDHTQGQSHKSQVG